MLSMEHGHMMTYGFLDKTWSAGGVSKVALLTGLMTLVHIPTNQV